MTPTTSEPPLGDSDRLDALYDVLANRRRLAVVQYLADNPHTTKGDLADHLSENEDNGRKTCYISLHQVHLPKMADAGVVDYDDQSGAVTVDDGFEEVQHILLSGVKRQGLVGRIISAVV